MNKPSSPTLADVARLAGVSTATISRVVNDPDKVAKPTREKIQRAIETLGYTPNFGGRILASNRITTVGAVIPTMSNAIFASGLQAFQEVLSEAGMTLLVASTGYNPDNELDQIRKLMAHGAGGLLLIGNERPAETQRFLKLRNVPYVIAWSYEDDPSQLFVGFNNEAAAYETAKEVLVRGHRKISVISGIVEGNDRARDRLVGTRRAVSETNGKARVLEVVEVKYRLQYGRDAFRHIMQGDAQPTAIICGNDVLAAGAITEARNMGLRVPEDISIVGFDDIGLASAVYPPLTTVRVPQIEMGRAAAHALLAQIAGKTDIKNIELKTEFVLRSSLGPAAR